jgi:hypothetical protein
VSLKNMSDNDYMVGAATGLLPAPSAAPKSKGGAKKGNRNALRHGLHSLNAKLRERINGRSALGRGMADARADLCRDLGGVDTLSAAQLKIVDLAVRTEVLVNSVDLWLLMRPSIVSGRKRSLLPVVTQRIALADSLARYLSMLGLERRAKEPKSIGEYLAGKASSIDTKAEPQP